MARRIMDEVSRSSSTLAALGERFAAESEMTRLVTGAAEAGMTRLLSGAAEAGMTRLLSGAAEAEMTHLLSGAAESEMTRLVTGAVESRMGRYDAGELVRDHEERRIFTDNMRSLDNLLVPVREEQKALTLSHLPTIEETLRLSKTAAEEIGAGLGPIASIHQEELQRLAEGISTPRIDKSLSEQTFTDFLNKTGISHPALFPPTPPPTEELESKESENDEHLARQRNLDAYGILFSLETKLREYIHGVMTDRYGPKWEKQQVSGKLRQEWERKRAQAIEKWEDERPLLWYADFTDYIDIICQRNNWREIFKPVFRNEVDIRASFQRLHPIRNSIMHPRVITKDDILLLTVEYRRILKAIGKLEDD